MASHSGHTCLLLVALAVLPASLAAQSIDSTRVHGLALQIAEDIRTFENRSDIQWVTVELVRIGDFFGIEFELPPAEGPIGSTLTVLHQEHGFEALLAEAARIDEAQGQSTWTEHAFESIARFDGTEVALEVARDRGLLVSMFGAVLTGAGPARFEEALDWLETAELDADDHLRFRAQAIQFGSNYRPHSFWLRADSLPEPYRTTIRLHALSRTTGLDTIPAALLEAELPSVVEVARTFDERTGQGAMRSVATACARRAIEVCDELGLPPMVDFAAGADIVGLSGSGLFEQATHRLDQLRTTEPPLVIGRLMAQAMRAAGLNCSPPACDLVAVDSLAGEWLDEILAIEADAIAGRIERTSNGNDHLMELQRALGYYLSTRDLEAVRELLDRMEDPAAVGTVLQRLIQAGPAADLIGAVETFLEYAPEGLQPMHVPYSDLLRAGRADLAEQLLETAAPYTVANARLARVRGLITAGRTSEAREVMHVLIHENTYQSAVIDSQLMISLQSLRMLDQYLDHVLALPTPLERLNGLYPIVTAWVRTARVRSQRVSHLPFPRDT